MPQELSARVVGVDHLNDNGSNRRFEIMLCAPGDPVELRPEPKNKADPHAIAVFNKQGGQMGYLTAERAPWIGSIINSGREVIAVFQEQARWGANIRIAFDGIWPTLPQPKPVPPQLEDEFWPDFIPPDD